MTPAELDGLVAGNVRAHRARLRLTQQQLADDLAWSRNSLVTLENDDRRVTLADAIALCRALQLDLRELLRGAPDDVLETLGLS